MKVYSIRSMLIISGITTVCAFNMLGCGDNKNADNKDKSTETAQQKTDIAATTPDTAVNTNTTPVIAAKKDSIKTVTATTAKKELTPAEKKKEAEVVKNQPVITPPPANTKPVVVPVKTPVTTPVTTTQPTPVVKTPEPVKPVIETPPVKTEPVKPVVTTPPPQSNWVVPAKYKSMTNPNPVNSESQQLGSSMYSMHCKSCHGSKGEGDGPKSANIETRIRSFLSAGFKAQTEGEVFYKSVFGKGDMPKFEKKIPDDEERWAVVRYVMNLK